MEKTMQSLQSTNPKWEGVAGVALDVDNEFTGVCSDVLLEQILTGHQIYGDKILGKFAREAFAPHPVSAVSCNGSVEAIAGLSDVLDDPSDNEYQKDTEPLSECLCNPLVEDSPI
jgi:hypothetical protein